MTNVANTVWQPNPGEGEYVVSTAVTIVDPVAVALVDPSSVAIIDTGVTYTSIDNTVWAGSDGS